MQAEVEYFLLNSSGMPDGTVRKTMVTIESDSEHEQMKKEVTQALEEKLGKSRDQFKIMLFTAQTGEKAGKAPSENENDIKCELSPRMGDYEGVFLKKDDEYLLELRVSGMALMNPECGLKNVNIQNWLCDAAMNFVGDMQAYEVLLITDQDVREGKLVTSWQSLQREESTLKINEKK